MGNFYLLLILVLIILSYSDLIVGVSIDALNSLNILLTSKSIPIRSLFWAAGFGILFGVIFSGGMREIARNGIFYTEKFSFFEILVIYLSVIIAGDFYS